MKSDFRGRPAVSDYAATAEAEVEPKAPATVEVEVAELALLRARSHTLGLVVDMARTAFKRGSLSVAEDLPSIALAAKIIGTTGQPL